MFNVGDVVNYENFVGVVVDSAPLKLALNDGTTKVVPSDKVVLLTSYKDLLQQFEDSILTQSGVN